MYLILEDFTKIYNLIPVLIKTDKHNGYLTQRSTHISACILTIQKCCEQKSKNQMKITSNVMCSMSMHYIITNTNHQQMH
jgi:hypothetical protein